MTNIITECNTCAQQNLCTLKNGACNTPTDCILYVPIKSHTVNDTRSHNVGASDYAKHKIQPWDIWLEYDLNPFDADIIKRVLRKKSGEDRKTEYEKIIHICQERIRQIDTQTKI
jgi:hypothetical protein